MNEEHEKQLSNWIKLRPVSGTVIEIPEQQYKFTISDKPLPFDLCYRKDLYKGKPLIGMKEAKGRGYKYFEELGKVDHA